LNSRTPARPGPQPGAFDPAWQPSHRYGDVWRIGCVAAPCSLHSISFPA